ncbi:hypothetical protein HNY73_002018 [Argiope bruennichi]|uniref:Uncharacterized protein n=1 Tax=Argiope bruennichi TaxID=94029 RepID=A0A8T0FYQ7_ARGBR|nr:hypothetical protein HNY73_002018 [Argiope bruennichi]
MCRGELHAKARRGPHVSSKASSRSVRTALKGQGDVLGEAGTKAPGQGVLLCVNIRPDPSAIAQKVRYLVGRDRGGYDTLPATGADTVPRRGTFPLFRPRVYEGDPKESGIINPLRTSLFLRCRYRCCLRGLPSLQQSMPSPKKYPHNIIPALWSPGPNNEHMLVIQFRRKKKEFPQLSLVPSGKTRQSTLLARTPVIDSIKIPRLLDFLRIHSTAPLAPGNSYPDEPYGDIRSTFFFSSGPLDSVVGGL